MCRLAAERALANVKPNSSKVTLDDITKADAGIKGDVVGVLIPLLSSHELLMLCAMITSSHFLKMAQLNLIDVDLEYRRLCPMIGVTSTLGCLNICLRLNSLKYVCDQSLIIITFRLITMQGDGVDPVTTLTLQITDVDVKRICDKRPEFKCVITAIDALEARSME